MLEGIYGKITVKTHATRSTLTIPSNGDKNEQLRDVLILIELTLKENCDKQLIEDFCDRLLK